MLMLRCDSLNSLSVNLSLLTLSLFVPAPSNSPKLSAEEQADRISCLAR